MQDNQKPMRELEEAIGYHFKNRQYLTVALTHSSYSNEMKSRGEKIPFNERLEFLGDSVLSIVVSSYIFEKYSKNQEGDLTKIRSSLVCEKALSKYASSFGLGDYMFLGRGERLNGGQNRPSTISDAFEALLAAIYLDSGEKFDNVSKFLIPFVEAELASVSEDNVPEDHKTALQQIVQQASGEILEYVLISEEGPAHDRKFKVEARLNSNIIGHGTGKTKREAEQLAAREALILFGELSE